MNLFNFLERFPDESPKNMYELAELAEKCKEEGFIESYNYLTQWIDRMNECLESEWFAPEGKTK